MKMERRFIPGSEWLYVKIYSGPKFLDEFLLGDVYDAVSELLTSKKIDKFFFVRYSDELGYHLRLRFHINAIDCGYVINVLYTLFEEHIKSRSISKIIYDTYSRELERYGDEAIQSIETIFSCNSLMILFRLRELQKSEKLEDRWLIGLKAADEIMEAFKFSLVMKYELSEHSYQMFVSEFKFSSDKIARSIVQEKFRQYRTRIEKEMMRSETEMSGFICQTLEVLRSEVELVSNLRTQGNLSVPIDKLVGSLVHMNYNRIFRTKHRLNEMLLHSLSSNYYRALKARLRN